MINKENIHQQIGFLSTSSTIIEEHGNARDSLKAESTHLDRPLIDVPRIITGIKTEYEHILCRVLCLSDEQIWTCGYSGSIMRLYNLQGVLVKSIKTKSGNWQADITVTQSGDLVYTDEDDKTVNTVKNTQIQTVIRLQGWRPVCVCSTSSGDLLVATVSDDNKQTKIVRYCDFTAKQSIQYNYKGQALFSSGPYIKCIIENRNLDICVVDSRAQYVVVVNQVGELLFIYNGFPSPSKPFKPVGVTTDSQSRILIADFNNRIHILDQEGKLLRYIDNCGLLRPVSVCVDSQDNLFVAELSLCAVKKIQYCA
ncbi:uncharacterized protein LOC128168812 [Crassostrea angulata]|uniref:uncharacterized protein LOC128168812 n=1 Tax=Magallana angulata TaxID=2784310 RepID=UPI0022B17E17|nr:uncharacterized protein LOC128168812 [Crassostrea angulata]